MNEENRQEACARILHSGKIHELRCTDEFQKLSVECPKHVAEEHPQCDAIA